MDKRERKEQGDVFDGAAARMRTQAQLHCPPCLPHPCRSSLVSQGHGGSQTLNIRGHSSPTRGF